MKNIFSATSDSSPASLEQLSRSETMYLHSVSTMGCELPDGEMLHFILFYFIYVNGLKGTELR